MRLKDLPGTVFEIFTGIPEVVETARRISVSVAGQSGKPDIKRMELDKLKVDFSWAETKVLLRALGYVTVAWLLTR